MLPWSTSGHCRRAAGCGIHLDHREAAPGVLGATRRAPPRLPGLTEHQRHEARRRNITGAWTWEQAAWPSTPRTWLSQNHVPLDVPTTWPRSVPSKVAPRSDDEGRVPNW